MTLENLCSEILETIKETPDFNETDLCEILEERFLFLRPMVEREDKDFFFIVADSGSSVALTRDLGLSDDLFKKICEQKLSNIEDKHYMEESDKHYSFELLELAMSACHKRIHEHNGNIRQFKPEDEEA